ncbi:MAG: aminoacyl-tRNA hydrolase [Alphaproteobacteria bacterium]|nr:aminoacyl-tRNA hydrolase [Alphaproteobacteria bacterium]
MTEALPCPARLGQGSAAMALIPITSRLAIDERELEESFIQASGPGGQNVNKVATAVQLRFDARNSPALTPEVRARLWKLAGRRITQDGILLIVAREHRTQERNRAAARQKLIELLKEATVQPRVRKATKPSKASKQRRLDSKTRRSSVKKLRQSRSDD